MEGDQTLLPETAIAEVGQAEEAAPGTFGAVESVQFLPPVENLAKDPETKQRVLDEVLPLVNWTRINRGEMEAEWNAIRRMRLLVHDEGQRYVGKSNAYIPIYAGNQRTQVSALSRGLFPSDDYLDVAAAQDGGDEEAKAVKHYLQWEFDTIAGLRRKAKPFLGQLVDYGNTVWKYQYKTDLRSMGGVRKSRTPLGVEELIHGFQARHTNEGLSISTRNMYHWYVYPLSCESLDDATMVFEDIEMSQADIEAMGRKKRWVNIDEAVSSTRPPEYDLNNIDGFSARGLGTPVDGETPALKSGRMKVVTEIWTFMELPRRMYLKHEDPEAPLPVRIVVCGSAILWVGRNPFYHQRTPYLWGRMGAEPGIAYGSGVGRLVRGLQYLANDFSNQTNDNLIWGMNPLAMINPAYLAGPLAAIGPGATWYFTDVQNGVRFDRPPVEQVQYGLQVLQTVISFAQDFGGAPPVLQGSGAGRQGKTATGMQILQHNARQPLQDLIEDLELDVMVPLMRGTWSNAQQYRKSDVLATVAGISRRIDPQNLVGDWHYKWLASSQAANQSMRAQQLTQFAQALLPLIPVLLQQGYVINFEPILRRIWGDGFGMRGFDQIVTRAQGMGGMPGMPGPGQMGGVMQEQGDRVRSAVEQIPGMLHSEMSAGEGEEFMDVRAQADDLAAMMGGAQ